MNNFDYKKNVFFFIVIDPSRYRTSSPIKTTEARLKRDQWMDFRVPRHRTKREPARIQRIYDQNGLHESDKLES